MPKRKKGRTHVDPTDSHPSSLVVRSRALSASPSSLLLNMRKMLMPYTAFKLKQRKFNRLKDFISISGPLNVSHVVIFTQNEESGRVSMRITKASKGPTLTFAVEEYCLMKDIVNSQSRPRSFSTEFKVPALLVMNKFSAMEDKVRELLTTTFQNMFPSISIGKMNLGDAKRVVLMTFENGVILVRHYAIATTTTGVSKGLKKLLKANKVSNKLMDLGNAKDVSELLTSTAYVSDTDTDGEEQVTVPEHPRGSVKTTQKSIKLQELGPRMTWRLVKIDSGVTGIKAGASLYHLKHAINSDAPVDGAEEAMSMDEEIEQ